MSNNDVKFNKPLTAIAIVIIGMLSLSVHTIMLQILHIPYPTGYPKNNWINLFDNIGITLALIYIYQFSYGKLQHWSPFAKVFILTVLLSALKEVLIRAPLMNAIVSSAWLHAFIDNLPALSTCFFIALPVVLLGPQQLTSFWKKILAAIFLASIIQYTIYPVAQSLTTYLLSLVPQPRLEDAIHAPYQLNVLIPAYLTYWEAAIACFIFAWLSWHNISPNPKNRLIVFTVLIVLLKRLLFAPFFYIFYSDFSPIMAMLSVGQFSLEAMTLALLTGIYMNFVYKRSNMSLSEPAQT
ncbi:hypothetical protein ACUHMQ_17895 [Chitinimonas sp. PSY-7]|uniref:hypothetical protein n=1 Tax=Chitinimonas sp. PSY-7 TaxID=3459088 RepID=UPI0040402BA5